MQPIRVLVADDHTLMRQGIRALLEDESDITVVGEAENGRVALQLVEELHPDVVLMDIAMPLLNGLDATYQIKRDHPEVTVLVLTMYDHEEYIRPVLTAGASGYVLKYAAANELVEAIRVVYQGEAVLSPGVTRLVLEDYLRQGKVQSETELDQLTPREREVLQLIAEGYTNKEISDILSLSIKTVKSHRTNLMQKLDLHNQGDIIKYAIQKKIIEI
ncbi:MAG: response regulator [Gammaproteobacteria bacterium]|nr:response regulator transcription factor [Phycisphaerae bacterium]NIW50180.1 response regulator [Gammaproteobacteria bacterium]